MNPSAICVYCGSNSGALPACTDAAARVGQTLARRGIDLIYGGGKVGLMGTLADAALHAGGRVIGIIPRDLAEKEMAHADLTDLHVVESMHARKALMAELADGFIVLPGGAGTMDEFFEIWTWGRLGLHAKPFGLLNVAGYFDPPHSLPRPHGGATFSEIRTSRAGADRQRRAGAARSLRRAHANADSQMA